MDNAPLTKLDPEQQETQIYPWQVWVTTWDEPDRFEIACSGMLKINIE